MPDSSLLYPVSLHFYPEFFPQMRLIVETDYQNLPFSVSLEDAFRHNEMTLFEKFKKTALILGVIAIAKSQIESVDDIRERVTSALRHIPVERLILAPDCGLGFLPKNILEQKLRNMVTLANSL